MKAIIVVIISFLFVFSVEAQDIQPTGRNNNVVMSDEVKFRGLVIDGLGKRVDGALITIADGKVRRELRSNKKGEFGDKLPAGKYRIVIEKPGYKKHIWEAYSITENTKTPREFKVRYAQAPNVHYIKSVTRLK
jgi:hypothetical protein